MEIEVMGKMGMGMQCWTGNGNDSMEWEGNRNKKVIPAHLYCKSYVAQN